MQINRLISYLQVDSYWVAAMGNSTFARKLNRGKDAMQQCSGARRACKEHNIDWKCQTEPINDGNRTEWSPIWFVHEWLRNRGFFFFFRLQWLVQNNANPRAQDLHVLAQPIRNYARTWDSESGGRGEEGKAGPDLEYEHDQSFRKPTRAHTAAILKFHGLENWLTLI